MSVKGVEKEMAALSALRSDPTTPAAVAALRAALASRVNLIVAKAAAIVQASEQSALCPDMAAALVRFFAPGSDKGCPAKTALTEALYTLGYGDAEAFLPGVRHVQMEASYGPSVDSAIDLRGYSALGLARAGYAAGAGRTASRPGAGVPADGRAGDGVRRGGRGCPAAAVQGAGG